MLKFFWALFSSCRGWWELISGQLNSSGSHWGHLHRNQNHLNHWNHRISISITAWFVLYYQYFLFLLYVSSKQWCKGLFSPATLMGNIFQRAAFILLFYANRNTEKNLSLSVTLLHFAEGVIHHCCQKNCLNDQQPEYTVVWIEQFNLKVK